jgi:hypothetical protein
MLAIMIGDFFHNLRSAMDHIVAATVPPSRRRDAMFPIYYEDIWAKNADGSWVFPDNKARENLRETDQGTP